MKFRKFNNQKLWRDKLVDSIGQSGSVVHWSSLDSSGFLEQLKVKLLEEAQEVFCAKTKESMVEELADVLEVVHSLCELHEVTLTQVHQVQEKKRQERGGFHGRKFVTCVEHPEGSVGEKYCLADPEKYPEMK